MMHSVQQLHDEDMNLGVIISEHLIPILEEQRNDDNIFSNESTFYISEVVICRT